MSSLSPVLCLALQHLEAQSTGRWDAASACLVPQLAMQLSITAEPAPDLQSGGPPVVLAPDAQQMPGLGLRPHLRELGLLFWKVILAGGHS